MTTTGLSPSEVIRRPGVTGRKVRHTEAAVLFGPGDVRVVTVYIPELKPGQVLVKVAYSGLCGSQLLEIRGQRGEDPFLPHTLGHEGSGTVIEVGEGVTKVKPGDRVILSWIKGSGADVASTTYDSAEGPISSGAVSTLMRHTVTSENRLTPISGSLPLREAVLLGCAFLTGGGIVVNTARVGSGMSVAIFGVGGVGLCAVMMASLVGAKPIVAIDLFQEKLECAKKLGATHIINVRKQDPLKVVFEITEGRGVDYAIEASGQQNAMETAFKSVRDQGGLCILAGNLPKRESISINPFDLIKGKRLLGTWGGESRPDRDIPSYIDLYLSGRLKLSEVISHVYALEDITQTLRDFEEGRLSRAVVEMSLGRN